MVAAHLPYLMDGHDVGMVQFAGRLGLGVKPADVIVRRQTALAEHLDRHHPV